MADGIIQYIRLMLDKASLDDVERQTASTAQKAASSIASVLTGVMNSSATASAKAAALASLALDKAAISLQKNATGYSSWQEAVRKALGSVGNAYDALRNKMQLVSVPNPEILNGIERARIRKQYKGDNAGMQAVLQQRMALNQLSGTQLTAMGKAAQFFGVNVAKVAPQVQTLIGRLQQLGASGTVIRKNMPLWSAGVSQFTGSLLALGRAFGFYYSARQAIDFLKDTVKEAGASQVAWAQLSTTIADYGGKLSELMPQIKPVFDQQAALGMSYTASAKALARLLQITGDFKGSLRALSIVQDIAASGFMTLEQASKQVGRAMLGDLGSISRYGIFLDKNSNVLDQLSKRFGGEQAMRAKTLTGSLDRLTVAWQQMKIAMGNALTSGTMGGGLFEQAIKQVQGLAGWVTQNQFAFKALGVVILTMFAAVGGVIFAFVNGLVTIVNTVATIMVGFETIGKSIPQLWEVMLGKMEIAFFKMWRNIITAVDDRFGTNYAKAIDGVLTRLEHRVAVSTKRINDNMKEGGKVIANIWEGVEGPMAPDARGNPDVLKIRAREHQRRMTDIHTVRANVLSGDPELRERGLEKLAKIEGIIADRMVEEKDNEEALLVLGQERAATEKIRADLEKKNNQTSKLEAAYRRKIERLTVVAREADDDEAMKAVRLLNAEHDRLLVKREKLTVGGDQWLKNEVNIKNVEDGINGHLIKRNQLFQDHIKKLGEMVDLNVNREEAEGILNSMAAIEQENFKQAKADMDAATRGSPAYVDALNRQIVAKHRLNEIDKALLNNDEQQDKRVDELEKQLKIADKRVAAERQLKTLQQQLDKSQFNPNLSPERKTHNAALSERITGVLGVGERDMKDIDKELSVAKELGKHTSTRGQAAAVLYGLQRKISDLLAKDNLGEAERLELTKQQLEVIKMQHDELEPMLSMADELRYIYENDLPAMAKTAAAELADVFDTALQGILRDTRLVSRSLELLPKGLAKAVLGEVAKMAKGKAAENLAWAIEDTARGFEALANPLTAELAPAWFTSAAEHTVAAAKWGLVGGVAGSLGASASAAYGNASDAVSGNRGNNVDGQQRGPDIYLTIDGVDPTNPRHQKLIGDTQREYAERYGGQIVTNTGR